MDSVRQKKGNDKLITLSFDGLCQPRNPGGVAAWGYLIQREGKTVRRGWGIVGEGRGMTNNIAEYTALAKALEWLVIQEFVLSYGILEIRGDSQLVLYQLSGRWAIKSITSQTFVPIIRKLLARWNWEVKFHWVPRELNDEADGLSRRAYESYMKQQGRKIEYMNLKDRK